MKSSSNFLNCSKFTKILILILIQVSLKIRCINFLEKSVTRKLKFNQDGNVHVMTKNLSFYEHPKILSETPMMVDSSSEMRTISTNQGEIHNSVTQSTYERPTYYSSVIENHPVEAMGGGESNGSVTLDLPKIKMNEMMIANNQLLQKVGMAGTINSPIHPTPMRTDIIEQTHEIDPNIALAQYEQNRIIPHELPKVSPSETLANVESHVQVPSNKESPQEETHKDIIQNNLNKINSKDIAPIHIEEVKTTLNIHNNPHETFKSHTTPNNIIATELQEKSNSLNDHHQISAYHISSENDKQVLNTAIIPNHNQQITSLLNQPVLELNTKENNHIVNHQNSIPLLHHIINLPNNNLIHSNIPDNQPEINEETIIHDLDLDSSLLLDLNKKSLKKMKKYFKETKFMMESLKEELLEENMDNPLKHKVEIENELESSIQNEIIMENIILNDIQPNIKEIEKKFLLDSESIKNFFEKEG